MKTAGKKNEKKKKKKEEDKGKEEIALALVVATAAAAYHLPQFTGVTPAATTANTLLDMKKQHQINERPTLPV